jgi:hypothetical protein
MHSSLFVFPQWYRYFVAVGKRSMLINVGPAEPPEHLATHPLPCAMKSSKIKSPYPKIGVGRKNCSSSITATMIAVIVD